MLGKNFLDIAKMIKEKQIFLFVFILCSFLFVSQVRAENQIYSGQSMICYYYDGTGTSCLERDYLITSTSKTCDDVNSGSNGYMGRKLYISKSQCESDKTCPAKESRCPDGTCRPYAIDCPCPSGQTKCPDGKCRNSCECIYCNSQFTNCSGDGTNECCYGHCESNQNLKVNIHKDNSNLIVPSLIITVIIGVIAIIIFLIAILKRK